MDERLVRKKLQNMVDGMQDALNGCEQMFQGLEQAVSVGEKLIDIIDRGARPNPLQLEAYRGQCAQARELMGPAQATIERLRKRLGIASSRH